jgi:hypothetical protein
VNVAEEPVSKDELFRDEEDASSDKAGEPAPAS